MSYSCIRTCAVVLLYCAVLFPQIGVIFSIRDSELVRTRHARDKSSLLIKRLHENHPVLKRAVLSNEMRSLLASLKRKKRITHHGPLSKMRKSTRIISPIYEQSTERTRATPLININDIERPIYREKHGDEQLLESNDIAFDDLYTDKIPIVRRAASDDSTLMSTPHHTSNTPSFSPTMGHTVAKRQDSLVSNVVVTEIIEVTATTVQRRDIVEESATTCITIPGFEPGGETAPPAPQAFAPAAVVAAPVPAAPAPIPAPPVAAVPVPAAPVPAGPAASVAVAGAPLQASAPAASFAGASGALGSIDMAKLTESCQGLPCNFSDTLSAILQNVETLAEKKAATSEDLPCQVNGTWISEAGGVQISIRIHEAELQIDCEELTAKKRNQEGFLRNSSWILTGKIPLPRKSLILINAVNAQDNKVATFMGECKICHRADTIFGLWMEERTSRDCPDQKNAFKIQTDLWRRDSMHGLKKHWEHTTGNARSTRQASNVTTTSTITSSTATDITTTTIASTTHK